MKTLIHRLTILLTVITVSLLSSCAKDHKCGCAPPPSLNYKHISASLKTDITSEWKETDFKDSIVNDSVLILSDKSNSLYSIKLKFSLSGAKKDNGMYETIPEAILYQRNTKFNALVYQLDTTASNFVMTQPPINDVDPAKKQWLTGYFEMTFKLVTPTGDSAFDAIPVNFSGNFAVKLAK
jgi:hypothetical protein